MLVDKSLVVEPIQENAKCYCELKLELKTKCLHLNTSHIFYFYSVIQILV